MKHPPHAEIESNECTYAAVEKAQKDGVFRVMSGCSDQVTINRGRSTGIANIHTTYITSREKFFVHMISYKRQPHLSSRRAGFALPTLLSMGQHSSTSTGKYIFT